MTNEELYDFYKSNPHSIEEFTLKDFTLGDLEKIFMELDKEVRKVNNGETIGNYIKHTYDILRMKVMENFINEYFTIANNSSMLSALEKAKAKSDSKPTPTERTNHGNDSVYPGQIIYMNLDGEERPYRVMNVEYGKVDLVGLFSIGKVEEKEDCYVGGEADKICCDWCVNLLPDFKANIFDICIPHSNETRYVLVPLEDDVRNWCKKWADDTFSWMWLDDEDMSNIRLLDTKSCTAVLDGEDGDIYHYYDDDEDDGFNGFEVHPAFTMALNDIQFRYDNKEWLECMKSYTERTK